MKTSAALLAGVLFLCPLGFNDPFYEWCIRYGGQYGQPGQPDTCCNNAGGWVAADGTCSRTPLSPNQMS